MTRPDSLADLRRGARAAFTVNAVLAWFGVVLVVFLSAADLYPHEIPDAHLFGHNPSGLAGAAPRVFDILSYFTIWSNIVVALDALALALQPERDTRWRRILRLDALMMIVVTAIVYALLLAPAMHPTGWSAFTNPLQHIAVPLVTVVVWLVWGPRGRLHLREIGGALVIPAIWIVFMFVRGAVTHAYPYGFVDVIRYGYPQVLLTIGLILLFGLFVGWILWVVDRWLGRRGSERAEHTAADSRR